MTAILRKDWRRLWPHAALFWLLLAVSAWLDPAYSGRMFVDDFKPVTAALVLACGSLIVSVMQQEAIPGDRQYWLTRPIARGQLLAAKGVFILLCVLAPVVLDQIAIYLSLGIPVGQHMGALLWREAFFVAFLVLPAAALAAVTRNIGQSILALVLVAAVVFAIGASEIVTFVVPVTMGVFAGSVVRGALFAGGAAAVLYLQYTRRATAASAGVMAITGVLFLLAIRSAFPVAGKAGEVFLELAPLAQAGPPAPLLSLEIPVHFEGVPATLDITVEELKIGIGDIHYPPPAYLRAFEGTLRRDGEGRGWLAVFHGQDVFARYLTANLRFHAQMTLVLSRPGVTLPRPGKQGIECLLSGGAWKGRRAALPRSCATRRGRAPPWRCNRRVARGGGSCR